MKKGILVILASFFLIASCSKGGSDDGGGGGTGGGGGSTVNCTGVASSFAANVNTIIQSTCTDAACHGAGSVNGPGPLLTYTQISGAASLIKTAVASGTMPKTGTLTTAQKNSIICWVNAGAPNN